MRIRELQKKIADALNGVEELVQGGCMVFPEDSMTVYNDIAQQLTNQAGVAICVVTPEVTKDGAAQGGIACEFVLDIQCSEKPALNRKKSGHMTALDAAEIVALKLDGDQFSFRDIRQTANVATGTVIATASFAFSGKISSQPTTPTTEE